MLSVGIVGKPNAGKSTLFNALTNQNVPAEDYPFCTIDKNTGVVAVPDEKLDKLTNLMDSQKKVPATVTFVDIAGLVEGASKGEGLGNMFLAHIREVDLILYLVGMHKDDQSPVDDLEVVETELILKDIDSVENKLVKLQKEVRHLKPDDKFHEIHKTLQKLKAYLENGNPAIAFMQKLSKKHCIQYIRDLFLLTSKKSIVVINVPEDCQTEKIKSNREAIAKFREKQGYINTQILTINSKVEFELSALDNKEKKEFIDKLDIEYVGLENIIHCCYKLLGYITFYTGNEKICNAWQISKGSTAKEAAGVIHTDLKKNFIRADIIKYKDFIQLGSWKGCKLKGAIMNVGKNYVMTNNDLMIVYHS